MDFTEILDFSEDGLGYSNEGKDAGAHAEAPPEDTKQQAKEASNKLLPATVSKKPEDHGFVMPSLDPAGDLVDNFIKFLNNNVPTYQNITKMVGWGTCSCIS